MQKEGYALFEIAYNESDCYEFLVWEKKKEKKKLIIKESSNGFSLIFGFSKDFRQFLTAKSVKRRTN